MADTQTFNVPLNSGTHEVLRHVAVIKGITMREVAELALRAGLAEITSTPEWGVAEQAYKDRRQAALAGLPRREVPVNAPSPTVDTFNNPPLVPDEIDGKPNFASAATSLTDLGAPKT